jgi:SAM-dependent methyltransferase
MNSFWDTRYSTLIHVYGKEPNSFFASQLKNLLPGRIILPGEGEGRNAVYAAIKGWTVDAFDQSGVAKEKALKLASEKGVQLSYSVCLLEDYRFIPNHYDAAALIFLHADTPSRQYLHRKVYESLKPGGVLILEAFHKDQLNNDTGGPKSLNLLFNERELSLDFAPFETLLLEKRVVVLNEGVFHQGEATVIRYMGKKLK